MKTTVKINKTFNGEGNLKGIASVNFDDCFAVTGIRIINSQKGLFVSMPNRKVSDTEYKDICFPVNKEFREELNNAVLDAYHQKMEESQGYENKNSQKQEQNGTENSEQESNAGAAPQEEQDALSENFEETESQGMSMGM